jgi:hypothetical protein
MSSSYAFNAHCNSADYVSNQWLIQQYFVNALRAELPLIRQFASLTCFFGTEPHTLMLYKSTSYFSA